MHTFLLLLAALASLCLVAFLAVSRERLCLHLRQHFHYSFIFVRILHAKVLLLEKIHEKIYCRLK